MTEHSVIVVADDLTVADLGEEAVLLDASTGMYYGLNEVGAHVLQSIRQPRSVSEIMDILLQEYDVGAEQLKGELLTFFEEMENRQLIQVEDEAGT